MGEPTSDSPDYYTPICGSLSDEDQPGSGGEGSASKEGTAPQRNTFEKPGSGMSGQCASVCVVHCGCVCAPV